MATSSSPDSSSAVHSTLSTKGLLAALVDSSDDAIISKNLEGIITSWNQGAERIFGYTEKEMIGQPVARLFPADRLDEEARILEQVRRGGRVDHYETVRVSKTGEHIDVSVTISPIKDSSGTIVGASKISRNITQQKRAVHELAQANEALRRADSMKAEFVATLSHELRTPLNAIVGWVQILKEGVAAEELAEGLAVIERNTRMQARLIEDLLDMSRIEAGKVSLDVQRLDIAAVVQAAIETVKPAAAAKQIRLSSAFSSIGGVIMGDRNRLQQIVFNLLTNAIKFTPKEGRVHVTIERVNSHVEIGVSDTGIGIGPEYLVGIFERFRQGDASTTRRHQGLGIGLSIAKQLAELHGGQVRAKSQGEGKGATFIISLPLVAAHHDQVRVAAEERNAAIDEAASDADLGGIKVLVVDDEADSVMVVKRILERRHAEVQTANSMEEALGVISAFKPHIVLSDIGMPDHDGYELIRRLRGMPDGKNIPAVALTALARSEDRTRALRVGFQMHLAKPVDSAELVAVVKNLATLQGNAGVG
jgi:PAS domain S-box-containing protein